MLNQIFQGLGWSSTQVNAKDIVDGYVGSLGPNAHKICKGWQLCTNARLRLQASFLQHSLRQTILMPSQSYVQEGLLPVSVVDDFLQGEGEGCEDVNLVQFPSGGRQRRSYAVHAKPVLQPCENVRVARLQRPSHFRRYQVEEHLAPRTGFPHQLGDVSSAAING